MYDVVALIHGSTGAYGISFPDFQGCVAGGATLDEVIRRGRDALDSHIRAMTDDGDALPPIRTLEQVKGDPVFAEDFADAVAVTFVPAELPGRSVRLNVSLDERLVARIDARAGELGESRSGFLATAARERLKG